jgi:hypothetical protein
LTAGSGAVNDDLFGVSGTRARDRRNLAELVDVTVTVAKQLTAYAHYGHVFGSGRRQADPRAGMRNDGYVKLTYLY